MKQLGDESFAVDWNPDISHEKITIDVLFSNGKKLTKVMD